MTTQAQNPDLCRADNDLLLAMAAEHSASMVVVEMLRVRVEGMAAAAGLLREQGAHGRELLKRIVDVTKNIVAADAAQREFKRVADESDEITSALIVAWRALLEASHIARMDLLALCFVDDTARKPWVRARLP